MTLAPRTARVLLVLLLASLAAVLVVERAFADVSVFEPAALRDALRALGPLGPLAYVLLVIVAVVVAPLPSVPLDIASGLLFGVIWGTVLTLVGDLAGALVAFTLARRLGRVWLAKRFGSARLAVVEEALGAITPRSLFVMRLLPVFSFELVSYAAGLSPIRARTFAVATVAGVALPVLGLVAAGDALVAHATAAGAALGALVLATVLLLGWWSRPVALRRARRR